VRWHRAGFSLLLALESRAHREGRPQIDTELRRFIDPAE